MITRYDVISSRWSSHFLVKCIFFTFLGDEKAQNVEKEEKCLTMSKFTCLVSKNVNSYINGGTNTPTDFLRLIKSAKKSVGGLTFLQTYFLADLIYLKKNCWWARNFKNRFFSGFNLF